MPTKMEEILEKMRQQAKSQATDPWEKIRSHVKKEELIPVVSNSFCIEPIFESYFPVKGNLSTFDQLTFLWAELLGYPMEDKLDLARVAQYHQVILKIEQQEKNEEGGT